MLTPLLPQPYLEISNIKTNPDPGDIVKLKSGGPDMTVCGEDDYGTFICQWFVEKNQPQSGHYGAEMLDLVKKNED